MVRNKQATKVQPARGRRSIASREGGKYTCLHVTTKNANETCGSSESTAPPPRSTPSGAFQTPRAFLSLSLLLPANTQQMTDLRTWVRYTKRCAPGGEPEPTAAPAAAGLSVPSAAAAGESPRLPRRGGRRRRAPPRAEGTLAEGSVVKTDPAEPAAWWDPAGFFRREGAGEGDEGVEGGDGGSRAQSEAGDLGGGEGGGGGGAAAARPPGSEGGGERKLARSRGQQQQQEGQPLVRWEVVEQGEEEEEEEEGEEEEEENGEELIGNVHFGFCDYYQTLVAEGLADNIMRLAKDHPTYNILLTGHSLGAAAAAVCAADLVQRLGIERDRVLLYTLGEPRTGDGIFAEGVNDRVVRFVLCKQIVCCRVFWRRFCVVMRKEGVGKRVK